MIEIDIPIPDTKIPPLPPLRDAITTHELIKPDSGGLLEDGCWLMEGRGGWGRLFDSFLTNFILERRVACYRCQHQESDGDILCRGCLSIYLAMFKTFSQGFKLE